jgi:hypothetical protein
MAEDQQPTLLPQDQIPPAAGGSSPPLTGDASIQAALGHFEIHMRDE